MKRLLFGMCMTLLLVILAACSDGNDGQEEVDVEAVPVELAEVVTDDIVLSRSVFGRVGLKEQEAVILPGAGEVTAVHVKNGDSVEKDDDLITFKSAMGEQKIKATTDGVVAKFSVRKDEKLSGEEPLLLIVDLDELEASFQMTRETRDLLVDMEEIDVLFGDQSVRGQMEAFDVLPNDTGQFDVLVTFDNKDAKLGIGDVVQLAVEEKRITDTIVLPTDALLTDDDLSYVFILDGDFVSRVDVEVLELQSDLVAVDGDLKAGDQVVVRGQFLLEDGSEVSVEKDGNES